MSYMKGLVEQSRPGFARVRFAEAGDLLSDWLPVIHSKTQNDKSIFTLDKGEQVACLMDEQLADGCIVGAVYSDIDVPPVSSPDKYRVQFSDGGVFEYDRIGGNMTVICKGALNLITNSAVNVTTGGKATVKAATVDIDGGGALGGIVQAGCLCAFTGAPHGNFSATVKGSI